MDDGECLVGSDQTRAARQGTRRAGAGRAISETAAELDARWHTVMRAVHRWGAALLEAGRARIDGVAALGFDEILLFRRGRRRDKHWGATIVDTRRGRPPDIVPGRSAEGATEWIRARPSQRRKQIRWGVMDLSGPYRKTLTDALPRARQIADPFHVIKPANTAAGDPHSEVRDAWHAKETLRGVHRIPQHPLAVETLDELARDLQDDTFSPELNKLGRTLPAWRTQITNWHRSHVTNGPTEAANNLAKLIKRTSFGNANFDHCRTRVLLYAGKPDRTLLDTLTPR